jgi:hypothetical protein
LRGSHEKINIIIPNKAEEQIIRAPINIPMIIVKTAESIDITPANILIIVERNIIGESNKKPIIRHHAS